MNFYYLIGRFLLILGLKKAISRILIRLGWHLCHWSLEYARKSDPEQNFLPLHVTMMLSRSFVNGKHAQ